jgi:hypothetical protein
MSGKLKVSFNSPQCGWMSIGFEDATSEFHTTTAHAPHREALAHLLDALADLLAPAADGLEFLVRWNRDPEEFDFWLRRDDGKIRLEIWQYATGDRRADAPETVFRHAGAATDVAAAFYETFRQMYEDRQTDEFEQNWRQPFPLKSFERFQNVFQNAATQNLR